MPRKKLIRTKVFPYHITTRSNNKDFFYLNTESIWSLFLKHLDILKTDYQCRIHAFVLMSNHYHLVLSTPQENISEAIMYLNGSIAKEANKKAKRENHFWGNRYKWCVINNEKYFWNAIKYVFNNPVRAGLTHFVEDYQFSSLNYPNKNLWEMVDYFQSPRQVIELDHDWLNFRFTKEQDICIRKGLRKDIFDIAPDKHRRKIPLNRTDFIFK
jgi:putative transposase